MMQSLLLSDTKIMHNTCSYNHGHQEILQIIGITIRQEVNKKITKINKLLDIVLDV